MGFWSFYFLSKLSLFAFDFIGFDWRWNLILALAALVPFDKWPGLKRGRQWVIGTLAVMLLWHDSYWPSPQRLFTEWKTIATFSPAYIAEVTSRFVSWRVVGALLLGWGAWYLVNKRVRLGLVAIAGILCVPVVERWPHEDEGAEVTSAALMPNIDEQRSDRSLGNLALDQKLQRFFSEQQGVSIDLRSPTGTPPFDLVFLSVCSLSWDDLRAVEQDRSAFIQRFDLLFKHFNTGASYSGPAVLRLLQSGCGQVPQGALYQVAPSHCYLFEQLARIGFQTQVRLNHQGELADFAQQLNLYGHVGKVVPPPSDLPAAMKGVDGTPVRGDLATLQSWVARPGTTPSAARALLYNTVTLHDGNDLAAGGPQTSKDTYAGVLRQLTNDLQEFMRQIEASGRPTVVVLVPEHGAGINGDARQVRGLREIPTPRLTDVPAGVALLGFGIDRSKMPQIVLDRVASYTALIGAIDTLLRAPHGTAPQALKRYAQQIPSTTWVSENDGTVVLKAQGRTYMKTGTSTTWSEYPEP